MRFAIIKMIEENYTLWFTGLHGSGKSTIANRLMEILRNKKIPAVLLDGGDIRKNISPDLGYSLEDRGEQMKRVAGMCKLISQSGVLAIAAVASLTKESREYARKNLNKILSVYVKCSFEVCEKRDVKGHYKKAKENEKSFEHFTKASSSFEEPENSDIILDTDKESIEESVNKLLEALKNKGIIDE